MTIFIANAGANHYSAATNNGSATLAIAFTNPTTFGNLLVCGVITNDTVSAPVDNLGASWSQVGFAGGNCDVAIYAKVAVGGETSVTANQASATGMAAMVVEWDSTVGNFQLTNIYTTASLVNNAGVANVFTGAAVTVLANSDMAYAVAGGDAGNYTFTSDAPWTTPDPTVAATGTGVLVSGGDTYQTGIVGSQSPLWVLSGASSNITTTTIVIADVAAAPGSSDPTSVDPSNANPPGLFQSPGNLGFWLPDTFDPSAQPPPLIPPGTDQRSGQPGHAFGTWG